MKMDKSLHHKTANSSVVALVPMRHDSKRLPKKNYRDFAGKPLYAHILETLSECEQITRIVVDTDSEIIAQGIAASYPSVLVLERPEKLRSGSISMNAVLLHDVGQVEADYYLQTHSTNPLLSSQTIEEALAAFMENYPAYDSLFTVTELHTRLWDKEGKPLNHNPNELLRTQDLPPVFEENSCVYIFERESFLRRENRIGQHPLLYPIDRFEAFDIDEPYDFLIAEGMKTYSHAR